MPMTRRHMMLCTLSAGFAPFAVSAAGLHAEGGLAFGSSWRITTDAGADLPNLRPQIEAVIADVDAQMSPYRSNSSLSAFNTSRATTWQAMPRAFCEVAGEALRVARITGGHFDPTVGPIVSRFGFGPITGGTGAFSGIEAAPTALRKASPDLTLDLCGIAKGHALDRIVAVLSRAGVENAVVEVGGEVSTLGQHPEGRPWAIAIADPSVPDIRAIKIVAPGGRALATSGPSVNGVSGTVGTSHIIDPNTRRPATGTLLSVSVLADTAMRADGLATALCAAGPDAGVALAHTLGTSALFVLEGSPQPVEIMTGRFADHILI